MKLIKSLALIALTLAVVPTAHATLILPATPVGSWSYNFNFTGLSGTDIKGVLYFTGTTGINSTGSLTSVPSSVYIYQTPQTYDLPTNNVFQTSNPTATTFTGGFTISNYAITGANFRLGYGQYDYYDFNYKFGNNYQNGLTANYHETFNDYVSVNGTPVYNASQYAFAVPEPSQWGAGALLLAVGALAFRRRLGLQA